MITWVIVLVLWILSGLINIVRKGDTVAKINYILAWGFLIFLIICRLVGR